VINTLFSQTSLFVWFVSIQTRHYHIMILPFVVIFNQTVFGGYKSQGTVSIRKF